MFKTKAGKPVRLRVTLIVEAESQKDLNKSIDEAAQLGKAVYMGISYRSKRASGPFVSCRTTRVRRKEQ